MGWFSWYQDDIPKRIELPILAPIKVGRSLEAEIEELVMSIVDYRLDELWH
jgi:hypothetical protein